MLTVHAAPGAELWAPTVEEALDLGDLLTDAVEVYYWPRARGDEVWRATHGGQPMPGDTPYVLRAWARGKVAHVLVDKTETKDSILWLTLHELTHLDLPGSKLVLVALRNEPRPENYLVDDDAHEARNEEKLANLVANMLAPRFGIASGYDRRWWRKRVEQLGCAGVGGRAVVDEFDAWNKSPDEWTYYQGKTILRPAVADKDTAETDEKVIGEVPNGEIVRTRFENTAGGGTRVIVRPAEQRAGVGVALPFFCSDVAGAAVRGRRG